MNIEKYYMVLSMIWIGWLLLENILTLKSDVFHSMVIIRKKNKTYRHGRDDIFDDESSWVLQDYSDRTSYNLKSKIQPSDYEKVLLVIYPLLLPVFGTYSWIKKEPMKPLVGCVLTVVLIVSVPYVYNFISALSVTFSDGVLSIGY